MKPQIGFFSFIESVGSWISAIFFFSFHTLHDMQRDTTNLSRNLSGRGKWASSIVLGDFQAPLANKHAHACSEIGVKWFLFLKHSQKALIKQVHNGHTDTKEDLKPFLNYLRNAYGR